MKELYRFRQFLAEGVIKENISSHKEEAKRFLEKFVDDNEDKFEFIPDLETGYIDANDNSYNVDELASIFLDIGQDIPKGTHNQKYKGEGGTYVVVSEGVIKEDKGINYLKDAFETYLAGGDTFTNKPGKTETVKFKNDGSLIPKKKFEAALQSLPTTVKVDVYRVNFKKVGDNIVGTFKIK